MFNESFLYALPIQNKDRRRNETFVYRSPFNLNKELGYATKNKTVFDFIEERMRNKDEILLGEREAR